MTQLSLQCHDKNSHIQFRIENDLKYVWNLFCKKHRYNQSELFRTWIIEFMKKKGDIREIKEAIFNPDLIKDIEDMPLDVKTISRIEVLL